MHHESRSFAGPMRTVGRIIELAREWSEKCNRVRPRDLPRVTEFMIPIKIDDDSAGGVIAARLREQGYRVIPVGAGTNAARPHRYPNKRSELWFTTRDRARMKDMMFLGLLPRRTLIDLYRQAKGVQWTTDSAGRRVVEQKDITRSRLGRSPDGMDAINLAFYPAAFASPQMVDVGEQKQTFRERLESTPERRSIIGRHGMGRHRGLFGR